MKIINPLYCFLIFNMSCQPIQPENTISERDCNCADLPIIDGPSFGYQFITNDSANYTRPFPNPNNADEFSLVQRSKRLDVLYTYNLKTKQKIKLLEGRILFVPKWGKNDWILVTREDEQIWKIKSNGDSLQQLSLIAPNYVPEWDYKGEKIIFYKNSDNPFSYIMDKKGVLLDSVAFNAGAGGDWNHPNGFFIRQGFVANGNIFMTDVRMRKPIMEILVDDGDPLGVTWINAEKIFASTSKGLYLADVNQKNSKKLKCACQTKSYLFPRYWQLRNKIIVGRITLTRMRGYDVNVDKQIVMMNIDGTEEEVINIPK